MESLDKVLLEYAEPFLDVENGMDDQELDAAMEVATAIWNAAVLDVRDGGEANLRDLRLEYETEGWPARQVVDSFVERKRDDYPFDLRLVERFDIHMQGSEIVFHVEEDTHGAFAPSDSEDVR